MPSRRLLSHHHDDHGGLVRDLRATNHLVGRRRMLGLLGAGTALGLVGCATRSTLDTAGGDGGSCSVLPDETSGPYPGDGSNGPNVLSLDGVVRRDIRASFGGPSGVAAGIPLEVTLSLVDAACVPLAGYAIYLWHCDRDGNYSLYSAAAAGGELPPRRSGDRRQRAR